jgi:hypothetical protein
MNLHNNINKKYEHIIAFQSINQLNLIIPYIYFILKASFFKSCFWDFLVLSLWFVALFSDQVAFITGTGIALPELNGG